MYDGVEFKSEQVFKYFNTSWNHGHIIDFETYGTIDYDKNDENMYNNVRPFIIGLLNLECDMISQYYVKDNYLDKKFLKTLMSCIYGPFYAFSSQFEKAVIKNFTDLDIEFRELQKPYSLTKTYYEKKQFTCNNLMIDNYDDPFDGDGGLCITEFEKGNIDDCLRHNRSCLFKERDVLNARGYYIND